MQALVKVLNLISDELKTDNIIIKLLAKLRQDKFHRNWDIFV